MSNLLNGSALNRFLWQVGGHDPRYRNFLLASGLTEDVDVKRKTLYDSLLEYHGKRINKYNDYWNLYYGNHWFEISQENLDPLKVNYCGITVNKNTAFLMNKGFQVSSPFPMIQNFLNKNWQLNNASKGANLFGVNLSIHGSVTGDAFFNVEIARHQDYEENYIKFNILDGLKSFPVYNKGNMIGFLYYGRETIVKQENFGFSEYDENYEGFYYSSDGFKYYIDEEKVISKSSLPLVGIPLIHIKNFPTPIVDYGISDLINIYDLNLTFDRVITDVQDIIDYHAQPITILKGAKATELTRGANRVWTIPKDADISNLKLEGELTATVEHMKRLREHIAELTNIPESSVGKQQAISNTSASALAITFMPLYETMEFKRVMYGSGLLRANTMALKLAYITGMLSPNKIIENALKQWQKDYADLPEEERMEFYPFSKEIDESINYDSVSAIINNQIPPELFETAITWYPPLPRDEDSQVNTLIAGVNNYIWSRQYARKQMGIDDKQSARLEKEIEAELEKFNKDTGLTITNSTGLEGNNNVKGSVESKRREQQARNIG
jgi:hypothetical protein